jgi:hypothetical protein
MFRFYRPRRYTSAVRVAIAIASLAVLLQAGDARAQDGPACEALIVVAADGSAQVSGQFSGLPPGSEATLFTGAKDAGVLKLAVKDGVAAFSYSSRHQIRVEDDSLILASPDFYLEGLRLDVEVELRFPPALVFDAAAPEPAERSLGRLLWRVADTSHFIVQAELRSRDTRAADGAARTKEGADATAPVEAPAGEQPAPSTDAPADASPPATPVTRFFDPRELPALRPEEAAQSAQELLEELSFALKVARAYGESDPAFLDVLDKLLAKLYVYLKARGLLEAGDS